MGILFEVTVPGIPQPRGSKKAFVRQGKNGKPRVNMVDDNVKSGDWMDIVRFQVSQELPKDWRVMTQQVFLRTMFIFPRPKGHFGKGKNANSVKRSAPIHHVQKPDLDKLDRAIGDALTGVVYRDDSQIVQRWSAKCWADEYLRPGVKIEVWDSHPNG